jgi:membrane-associated HD superfamily phosphohydrolase
MAIAVVATLFSTELEEGGGVNWTNIGLIVGAIAIGGLVSSIMALGLIALFWPLIQNAFTRVLARPAV